MKNKKISITTHSVEKITVNVQKVHLKPHESEGEASPAASEVELLLPEDTSTEFKSDDLDANLED